jgi:hypothetical protein
MKVPKEKRKVNILCTDGSFVKGFVHIAEGLRVLDFFNDLNENFIVVTEAQFQNIKEVHSFQLVLDLNKKKGTVILSKAAIKWVEEI